ncbi:MAG: hypothetical protein SOU51_03745 [Collinsella sp.]|nr:hypothetical protein [Collinsella sp.]
MSIWGDGAFSRRTFTAASAAAAALASISLAGCGEAATPKKSTGDPQVIEDDSLITSALEDYKGQDVGLFPVQSWTLPLGTVLFHSEGSWAAAMMTPEDALHINTLGVLSLDSGSLTTLKMDPELGRGYSFFDVRCGSGVFAWVEIDYNTLDWTLLAQSFSGGALSGDPVKLDGGDKDWEPPMFSTAGSSVVWLKMPMATGSKSASDSLCHLWTVGDVEGTRIWTSQGRFATHPRISDGVLTITPRVRNDEGTYYGMTAIDLGDGGKTQLDQLVLPASVRPFDAVYTGELFAFSIEASYESSGSLGNMGTFVGREGGPFVFFGREPSAQVAYSGSRFFIKTQSAHYMIDTAEQIIDTISSPDRSLDFGDYPASEGHVSRFLTFATVRDARGVPSSVIARTFNV